MEKTLNSQCMSAWYLQAVMRGFCSAQLVEPKLTHPAGSQGVCCQVLSISLICLPGCSSVCVSTALPLTHLEKAQVLCVPAASSGCCCHPENTVQGVRATPVPESLFRLHWLS